MYCLDFSCLNKAIATILTTTLVLCMDPVNIPENGSYLPLIILRDNTYYIDIVYKESDSDRIAYLIYFINNKIYLILFSILKKYLNNGHRFS